MRIIRYFRTGYLLILLTPVLSLAVFLFLLPLLGAALSPFGIPNYLLTSVLFTVWNFLIVVLLIIGIVLYMYGYLRREATDSEAKVTLLFSFFLIPWGVLTYLIASGLYLDLIDWSMNPGVRALTIWDYMEYWTWELKALFWVGTGLLLIATSLLKIVTSRLKTHVR